jgi:CheY-like chemotaxis protein
VNRILVIDDDGDVREYIRRTLEPRGYPVYEAANGKEAMAMAHLDKFDLVILDMLMPVMDGAETILHLRSLPEEPKIIAISGGSPTIPGEVCHRVAEMAGAARTLDKPVSKKALLSCVQQLLGEKR